MKHSLGDLERINHILDAIKKIEIILDGISMEDFISNFEKSLAVERF
ncbi:MAG: hypothetical protein Q4G16_01950 [Cruoricaptor ignavus]|nr:hypothetical protein [Cruoricaptor ignavus]